MAWGTRDSSGLPRVGSGSTEPAFLDVLERRVWLSVWRSPVLDAVEEGGIEARFFGPVWTLTIAELAHEPLLNMVLGAALPGAVGEGHLAAALEWVESLGAQCHVPLSAAAPEAAAAEDLLNRRGYERWENRGRFAREASPRGLPAPPGVEVGELEGFTEGFGETLAAALGMDPMASSLLGCLPERAEWRSYYAVREGEGGIAYASMMVDCEVAQLGFAATPEAARGGGRHMALIRRRVLDAAGRGCRTVVAETRESPGEREEPSAACRNLVRAGFRQAGSRRVWRVPWSAAGEPGASEDLEGLDDDWEGEEDFDDFEDEEEDSDEEGFE